MCEFYKYTKRLGQQHLAKSGTSNTLCGMPMLGNNYERDCLKDYIVGEIKPCEDCQKMSKELTNVKKKINK